MPDTFEELSRKLQVYCPVVPISLCEHWIEKRFRQLLRKKDWSWALSDSQWSFAATYSTGTVTVTNASTTVTGLNTVWTSAMVGRAFKCNDEVFRITAVGSTTSLTLDQVWGDSTAATQTYEIVDCYKVAPSDFRGFKVVVNAPDGYRLRTHISRQKLDVTDPQRTSTGNPLWVVDYKYDSSTSLPMYEIWPHPTKVLQLKVLYYNKTTDFSNATTLPYFVDGDVLVEGGLVDLCRWPGTLEKPNPLLSTRSALEHDSEWREGISEMMLADEKIFVSSIWDEYVKYPSAPLDLRNHAVGQSIWKG